jgi:uncharacterized protein YhbP (UPF0306 family)
MPVIASSRRLSARRLEDATRSLLDASTLCAIATVAPGGRAHVNTAYFAWSDTFEIVWLSAPEARHSRNLNANPSAAVSVFDSTQAWGKPDRGIQLFGPAAETSGSRLQAAQKVYGSRFREYAPEEFRGYRIYRLRPRRLKLFDERKLGPGVFITASVRGGGRLEWSRTELYRNR